MLQDRHGNPIQPDNNPSEAPRTAQALRQAVENGELGPVVTEQPESEIEQNRLRQQASVRFTCQMLEKMARDLEKAEGGEKNMQKRHAMMDTARAFRISILWLLRPMEEGPSQPEKANDNS